ncbi:hypothetical protein [Ancylobacter terrae]|uniref:hypothetical protein n=1 Tax=Ancylobacter sp. sgz301288 TaxID=3342077 RepID=UPI003859D1F1
MMPVTRRALLPTLLAALALPATTRLATASPTALDFDELYGAISVLGLEFSGKVKELDGKPVAMKGFMAPPLKAESNFFVLTEIPMSICPFCSSDADWPDNILVVYLDARQTFVQTNGVIRVSGILEVGSWTDPETGFVSRLRLRGASFAAA